MTRLTLSLLGTFQVSRDDQIITHFRSANVQGLLVYLALQAERPFPREVLAALFWPDVPDKVALTNLRQSLYQLRKVIGDEDERGQPYLLVTRQNIQFNQAADVACDAAQFHTAVAAGDLQTAVAHYQGELLPGFTCNSLLFEEWLLATRETYHREALDLFYAYTEQLLQKKEWGRARYLAQQQLALEPWREKAHRQLMQALVLNGERSAALAQYETCCQLLQAELGVEPEAATVALYEQILAGEDDVLPGHTAVPPPLKLRPLHNLPAHVSPFFNREEVQRLLIERLSQPDYRFVTLVGEGGIGKSRLAQETAVALVDHFPDGVWFVPLAGLAESESETQTQNSIATAVAQSINFPLQGRKTPKEQIIAFLRERRTLLLLDNFEHLLAGAELVMELLEQAAETAVLCTSRQPLNFMAESIITLEPLSLPPIKPGLKAADTALDVPLDQYPALQLFLDRAVRADGRFGLTTDNEAAVTHLCQLVSGIPLALELAAASLRQRPLPDLLQALRDNLDTLTTQFRDIPDRHRSMRAVFNNSWGLLAETEQQLFAGLSLFRGGFTAEAAQVVAGSDAGRLEALVNKSLLRVNQDGRYDMHELLRQFALEKGTELGLADTKARLHSQYYLTMVAEQAEPLVGEAPWEPAAQIAAELDNVREAWQTAVNLRLAELISASAQPLADFCQIHGFYQEGEQLFARAASVFELSDSSDIGVRLTTHRAGLLVRLSKYETAVALIKDALAAIIDDSWLQNRLHITWGEALWRQGQLDEAESHLQQALQSAQTDSQLILVGFVNFHLGVVFDYRGRREEALTYFEEALVVWQEIGNRRQQGFTLISIGGVARHLPDKQKAEEALNEALIISQENDDFQGQSMALNNLSLIATEKKEFESAREFLFKALELVKFTGDEHGQALVMYNLGWSAMEAGWLEEAEQFAESAHQLRRRIGDQRGEGLALSLLGALSQKNGRTAEARSYYQAALKLSRLVGDRHNTEATVAALQALPA